MLGEGQHGVALVDQVGADRARGGAGTAAPAPQFGDDEVVQRQPLGMARARHRQDVAPQPADQRRHVVGQGHRGRRGRPGVAEFLADAAVASALLAFALGLLAVPA